MKFDIKTYFNAFKWFILFIICMMLEYLLIQYLSNLLEDKNLIGYYISFINIFVAAVVPMIVLYVQIKSNHNQFSYNQKKNDISTIIDLSIEYLNLYNIDILKQLLYEWQYNINSRENLSKELRQLKEKANTSWLRFSFEINPDDNLSTEFISNQAENYKILCHIIADLEILFKYNYSNLRDPKSDAYQKLSESGSRLQYCLNEKFLVNAVFEDYDISYSRVKNEINEYLNKLKSNLTDTLKVYG